MDDEPDVIIIKEERPGSMRCEQSERETETAENRKYAVLYLIFVYISMCVYFILTSDCCSCPPAMWMAKSI